VKIAQNQQNLIIISTMTTFIYIEVMPDLVLQVGRRFPVEPNQISLRVAFYSISILGFVLISLYKAMLGASLAIKIYRAPVHSLHDLYYSDLSLAVVGSSSVQRYFSGAENSSIQGLIWATKLQEPGALITSTQVRIEYKITTALYREEASRGKGFAK
jgi:hypothetical protein